MRAVSIICRVYIGLCIVAAIPLVGFGQGRDPADEIGGPLTGSVVLNAPFSADATTTVRLTFRDGTKLEQSTTARYYRDSVGRARVEFLMNGLEAAKTMAERHIKTLIGPTAPEGRGVFILDAETRTARNLPRYFLADAAGGESEFAVPIGGVRFVTFRRAQDLLNRNLPGEPVSYAEQKESLGSRRIAGVETIGSRVTMTIPVGQWRNDKPIELVDERWESSELKLLIAAQFSDSRTGDVEYRLANIRRVEPPPDLFEVPADYTLDAPPDWSTGGWLWMMRADAYTAKAALRGRAR